MVKSFFPYLGNLRQIRRVRFLEMHRNYLGKWSTTCSKLRRPRGATIASLSTLLSLFLVVVDEVWVDALHNFARRPEDSSIRDVRAERHTDRGEGGSRGVPQLSGSFQIHFCCSMPSTLTGYQRSWSGTERRIPVCSTKSFEYFRSLRFSLPSVCGD